MTLFLPTIYKSKILLEGQKESFGPPDESHQVIGVTHTTVDSLEDSHVKAYLSFDADLLAGSDC